MRLDPGEIMVPCGSRTLRLLAVRSNQLSYETSYTRTISPWIEWRTGNLEQFPFQSMAMMTPGLLQELSPQPLAPEARIMPLDQTASCKHDLQQDTDSRIRYYLTG